jgi:hypothetical protein
MPARRDRGQPARHVGGRQPLFILRFVALASGVRKHAHDEEASKGLHNRDGSVGGVLVLLDHGLGQPADRVLGFTHHRWWFLVEPRRAEEFSGDVVDGRQPLLRVVAVDGPVELERAMAALQRIGGVLLGGVKEFIGGLAALAYGQRVGDVDCDAQGGGRRDGDADERDRPRKLSLCSASSDRRRPARWARL